MGDDSMERFDIQSVIDNLRRCKGSDGCLYLDGYLSAYHELHKFLVSMGTVFTFVDSDVQQKVTLLECLRNGGAGVQYVTVESMIEYESGSGLLDSDMSTNGCRTLLRLHRAIEFISALLREIGRRGDGEKMSSVGRDVYRRTLARHHMWLVQKAALVAMFALGTRRDMFNNVVGLRAADEESGRLLLEQCITEMDDVHARMQELFVENHLDKLV